MATQLAFWLSLSHMVCFEDTMRILLDQSIAEKEDVFEIG